MCWVHDSTPERRTENIDYNGGMDRMHNPGYSGIFPIRREDAMPRMRAYLTRAGYISRLAEVSPEIMETAREVYLAGLEVSSPLAVAIGLEGDRVDEGILPEALRGCAHYHFMLLTLGRPIDGWIDRFFGETEPLRGTLLDAWGSEAVEALAQNIDDKLRAAQTEMSGTIRFAPGYGGFDVRMNAAWLDLIKWNIDSAIDVDVDRNTGVITPRKSIVCAIGWKKKQENK